MKPNDDDTGPPTSSITFVVSASVAVLRWFIVMKRRLDIASGPIVKPPGSCESRCCSQVEKLIVFESSHDEDDAQGKAGGLGDVEQTAEDTGAPFTKRWDMQIRITAANVSANLS